MRAWVAKIASPGTLLCMTTDLTGKRIRDLRRQAGLNASDLGKALGLSETAISNIENGKRHVKTGDLAGISKLLGVSPLAILQPESLLGRLPVAARSATAEMDQEIHERLTSLAELHTILLDAGIETARPPADWPERVPGDFLTNAEHFATWARDNLEMDAVGDRFEDLASAMERSLGIDVLVESTGSEAGMGASITDSEFPFAYVNAGLPRARAMFTLAHELGHILANDGVRLNVDRTLSATDDREKFANAFAAELLMPRSEIDRILQDKGRGPVGLAEIMVQLQVSFESMVYRLHNLKYTNFEGRDRMLSMRFGGLLGELEDSELKTALVALRNTADQDRPPSLLLERLMRGYESGVVSVRPIAGLLNEDIDELLETLASGPASDELLDSVFSVSDPPPTNDEVSAEELFAGDPV